MNYQLKILLSSRENLALVSSQAFNERLMFGCWGGGGVGVWGKGRRDSDYVLSEEQLPTGRIPDL